MVVVLDGKGVCFLEFINLFSMGLCCLNLSIFLASVDLIVLGIFNCFQQGIQFEKVVFIFICQLCFFISILFFRHLCSSRLFLQTLCLHTSCIDIVISLTQLQRTVWFLLFFSMFHYQCSPSKFNTKRFSQERYEDCQNYYIWFLTAQTLK